MMTEHGMHRCATTVLYAWLYVWLVLLSAVTLLL